jgi:hypothetical protein
MTPYSPERRTALVLCGTGADGAYQAGVLHALEEAGVKIDVMAGQGVGAASAALAAIAGAARLWEADGLWRGDAVRSFYRWTWPLRAAGWLALLLAASVTAPPVLLAFGLSIAPVEWAIAPLVVLCTLMLVLVVGGALIDLRRPVRRRAEGRPWWHILGAPVDVDGVRIAFAGALWHLIRGASRPGEPTAPPVGRRYAEVLAENLGQPGFRELMLVVTDLDSRRDLVAAMLREPFHREFVSARPERERQSEIVDLAGAGRDHAFDLIGAALTPPCACDPQLVTFGVDSYWRGETHRLCDRPGACSRLLEELAAAGVSQVIIVSAVAASRMPHRLTAPPLEIRRRLGESLAAAESAALRDALEMARLRFDSVYLISPTHNPIGAFDLAGAYDEASDRRQDLVELMGRAYEDAYHQFIEPVVGASGDHLARAAARNADMAR